VASGVYKSWASCTFVGKLCELFPSERDAELGLTCLFGVMSKPGTVFFDSNRSPPVQRINSTEPGTGHTAFANDFKRQMADKAKSKMVPKAFSFVPVLNEILLRNDKFKMVPVWPEVSMDSFTKKGYLTSLGISALAARLWELWDSNTSMQSFIRDYKILNSSPPTGSAGCAPDEDGAETCDGKLGDTITTAELAFRLRIIGFVNNKREMSKWRLVWKRNSIAQKECWIPQQRENGEAQVPFRSAGLHMESFLHMLDGADKSKGELVKDSLQVGAPHGDLRAAEMRPSNLPSPGIEVFDDDSALVLDSDQDSGAVAPGAPSTGDVGGAEAIVDMSTSNAPTPASGGRKRGRSRRVSPAYLPGTGNGTDSAEVLRTARVVRSKKPAGSAASSGSTDSNTMLSELIKQQEQQHQDVIGVFRSSTSELVGAVRQMGAPAAASASDTAKAVDDIRSDLDAKFKEHSTQMQLDVTKQVSEALSGELVDVKAQLAAIVTMLTANQQQ